MAVIRKDRIKDQMLKTAARLWSIPENEIETTFDPLILLMMEACAAELEKIGYDINASHERLLDKLANLILPEAMLGAMPASCIMHAMPTESTTNIDSLTRFYTTLRASGNSAGGAGQSQDIFFSPIGDFILHKASLVYTLIGGKLFRISEQGGKELISGAGAAMDLTEDIWLAIAPDKDLKSLKGLGIFFDLRGHSEADTFYKSLDTARGWIGPEDAQLHAGYHNAAQFDLGLNDLLESGDDYTRKIAREVAGIWSRRFLCVGNDTPLSSLLSPSIPDAWRTKVGNEAIKQLEAQPLIYLRIQPGRIFHQEVLETASISINAFPAVNRRFHTLNYRSDAWINIIPIKVDSNFLALHSITGTGGKYRFRISSGTQEMEEGEALIRSTGIGKTDSREVREIIASLMEAIRDESAFFSELNNEFIQGRLREISQIVARLEDQVAEARDTQSSYQYVLLRPFKAGEQLTINYWTTNGQDAHAAKAGAALIPFNHSLVSAKECYTLTNLLGGGTGPSPVQKRNMLKQQLHSRGKIVSAEDVRLLCMQLFGERLKKVEVRKGVQVGTGAQEGFSRSIDVLLTLTTESTEYGQAEVEYLRSELENTLKQSASPVYPFRVLTR